VRTRDLCWGIALFAGCSFHADCGGKGKVDTKQIETTLTGDPERGVTFTKATCPDQEIEAKVGAWIECDVEVDGRKTYPLRVTVSEVKGTKLSFKTTYVKPNVSEQQIRDTYGASVAKQLGVPVGIDCGEPLPAVPDDRLLRCDATVGTMKTSVVLTFTDDGGSRGKLADAFYITTVLAAEVQPELTDGERVDCGAADARPIPSDHMVNCSLLGAEGKPIGQIRIELDDSGHAVRVTTLAVQPI
jgi:hypothetical protein